MKKFKNQEIRDLLNQVYRDEISFSRMVEIMNERVSEAEKKCVNDIPKRKFKVGDKVRIKHGVSCFMGGMDDLIGKTMTVNRYTRPEVGCYVEGDESESEFVFHEDWLEPYAEDIPKRKFKKGDKVVLKSGYKKSDGLIYLDVFDLFIGRKITVAGYTDVGNVCFSDCPYIFEEEWLEPYVEELKRGDLAIFWDEDKRHAIIKPYGRSIGGEEDYFQHKDQNGLRWRNATKFESKEQYELFIKGEI